MSAIKANKHQIGSNATASKNIVLDTDTSTGDLVISKGVHDGVLTELYRFPNGGGLRDTVSVFDFMSAAQIADIKTGTASIDVTDEIQNAVNEHAFVRAPAGAYLVSGNISIPFGHMLFGDATALNPAGFMGEVSLTSSSVPSGTTFCITSTTVSPITLRSGSAVQGINFFYPDQNYSITSLAESFITYPKTIVLGNATEPGPSNCTVQWCNFMGGTTFIGQYDASAASVKSLNVHGCGGWVLNGSIINIGKATDVCHISNCHFTPNYLTQFVVAKGGNADKFRTKAISLSTKCLVFGQIDLVNVSDFFIFGVTTLCHFNNNMFSGDTNEGGGGHFVNVSADCVQVAYRIDRGSNAFGLHISNGTYTPILLPSGSAGDAALASFINVGSSLSSVRCTVSNVRVYGGTVGEFDSGYSGYPDYIFNGSAAQPATNHVTTTNCSFANYNTGIKHPNVKQTVLLDNWVQNDLFIGGRSRSLIGPFTSANVAANNSGEFMYFAATTAAAAMTSVPAGISMLRSGRVSGITIQTDNELTAASLYAFAFLDSTPSAMTATVTSGNSRSYAVQDNNNDLFVAGTLLRVRLVSGAITPTTVDVVVFIEVTYTE